MQVRSMHANSRRNKINASAGQLNKFVSAHSGLEHAVSDDEVRQMKAQHQAAIRIQARQRGNANRRHVQDIKGKKVEEMRAEHAAIIIQKRARGMLARSGSRHGVSTSNRLRGHTPSTHAGTAYSESDFEQDEDDYDDEFEEDVEPQWIGAECDAAAQVLQAFCRTQISLREVALSRSGSEVRRELQRQETITRERDEARQAELEKQRASPLIEFKSFTKTASVAEFAVIPKYIFRVFFHTGICPWFQKIVSPVSKILSGGFPCLNRPFFLYSPGLNYR